MEGFALNHDVVLITEFLLDFIDFLAGEAGDDAVNERRADIAVGVEPCLECLIVSAEIFFPKFDIFVDDIFQVVSVFEDKFAGHDDKALVGSSVECLEATIEKLGQLAGIGSGGTVRKLALGVESDAGLGSVGNHEAHFGLVGQCEECVKLSEGAEAAADYIDAGKGIDDLTVETALKIDMVEAVLALKELHYKCIGSALHDYN